MEDINKDINNINHIKKTGNIMEEFMTNEQKKYLNQAQQSQQKRSRSDKSIPDDDLKLIKYRRYYDTSDTITTAQATDPNDSEHTNYNQEEIFAILERNAEIITVANDGTDTLYVIASHDGGTTFSRERPIYSGENKTYFNVFELRLRSPTAGLPYRVTEYDLCCKGGTSGASAGFSPIAKASIHNTALPAANADWLAADLSPSNTPTTFRIEVAVSITGNFQAEITNGGNTQTVTLNAIPGPALVAGGLYIFDIMIHSGDTINFSYSTTTGTIQVFRVQEIDAASA